MPRKKIKKSPKKKERRKVRAPKEKVREIKIKVIGIGGGGNSIVADIAPRMKGVGFVAANTDVKALKKLGKRVRCFQFGKDMTGGMGTGMDFELGRMAAQKEEKKIKNLLNKQDFCIFVSCLGGGTGSGAIPVFAKASKELGNVNFGIFTLPFKFEGGKKAEIARETLIKARSYFQAFSVIPNERIFKVVDQKTPLKEALSAINGRLTEGLGGLIEMIKRPGLINVDFADLRTILAQKRRLAFLNKVEIKKGVQEEIGELIYSPLYPYDIQGAKGLLFNIVGGSSLGIGEVNRISRGLQRLVGRQAKIIFGVSQKRELKDKLALTLLATGCETKERIFPKVVKTRTHKVIIPSVKELASTKKRKKSEKKIEKSAKKVKKIKIKISTPATSIVKKRKRPRKKRVLKVKKETPKVKKISESREITPEREKTSMVAEKVRRSALQIKRELEKEEKERIEREKTWEIPAILRRKNQKV